MAECIGRPQLVISATKELEPGFRAMLLLAEGLFRFDVVVHGDSLATIVRNLSGGALTMRDVASGRGGESTAYGEIVAFAPGRGETGFTLGRGADLISVQVTIATLRLAEQGTVRVSAQAIAGPAREGGRT